MIVNARIAEAQVLKILMVLSHVCTAVLISIVNKTLKELRVGDEYCFAEELANALGQAVEAPNDKLYIDENGGLRVVLLGDGDFITFEPNERRRMR